MVLVLGMNDNDVGLWCADNTLSVSTCFTYIPIGIFWKGTSNSCFITIPGGLRITHPFKITLVCVYCGFVVTCSLRLRLVLKAT